MNKRIAALLGGSAALMTMNASQGAVAAPANPPASPSPQSYAELLAPIPNALAQLQADDAARAQQPPTRLQLAQYYHHHHHHHHHHHGYYGGAAVLGGVIGGLLATQPRYYGPPPTCYWTLGRPYWNGYRWIRPRVQVCP